MQDTLFDGIYRDDRLLVFNNIKPTEEVCQWLFDFQKEINFLTESEYLQFMVDIWNPNAPIDEVPSYEKVTICRDKHFPYLDMELFW
jgi:hypothetical protein